MTSTVPLLKDPQKRRVQETLLQFQVPPKTARDAASVQLRNFTAEELSSTFRKLRRRGADLKTFDFAATTGLVSSMANLLSGRRRESSWLMPALELMERSAKENLALCVNALGEWSVRREGYFAISHVWQEGIQADPNNGGMPVAHVKQILDRVSITGAEWIWLDGLAIPGSSEALTLQEEELKITIINNLASIYRQASAVIILDALVMQLQSTDSIDTAICLLCGQWMTRLWTYQEIYLASKALILTERGLVDFVDMTRTLRALSCNDGDLSEILGEGNPETVSGMSKSKDKYHQLYVAFARLLGSDGLKPSLTQIALSCRDRKTGNYIDYARAFFPVLGLSWKLHLTREEGMALIFAEQIDSYALRLILMTGSPRLSLWPGWAPSYLTGLEGLPVYDDPILGDIKWEKRGLKRHWYTYKVEKQDTNYQHDGLRLELSGGDNVRLPCVCETSHIERAQSLNGLQDAITKGSVYLLSQSILSIPSKDGSGYRVLLVERDDKVLDDNEAWVYLTATVILLQETISGKPVPWLILHENPFPPTEFLPRGGQRSGKDYSTYARDKSDEAQFHRKLNPFHIAAKEDDVSTLRQLLATNKNEIEARDERGWTPLHTAAFNGYVSSVKLLLGHCSSVDVEDIDGRSPLMLAADDGHIDVVRELLQYGANVNLSGPKAECSLNLAIRGGIMTLSGLYSVPAPTLQTKTNIGSPPLRLHR